MDIIIFVVVLVVIFYFVYIKYGNLSFWRKASKNPDYVHQCLSNDDAWLIDDGTLPSIQDKSGLDGPFLLYVPSLGKTIKFYGKVGKYEDSQKMIEKELE